MRAGKSKVSITATALLLLGFISNQAWALSAVAVADGGNWSDPATWDIGAVPGVDDTAFIRSGYTVTLSAMEDVKLLNIGDLASSGTVNIVEGGKLTVGAMSYVGRQKSGADGYLNLSGGILQMGDPEGSLNLLVGIDTATESVNGLFTISGGTFAGRLIIGSTIQGDTGNDILRIAGSKAKIGNTSDVGQYSLEVRPSGTVEYIFDSEGISGMEFSKIATFADGAKIIVDGAAYKGGKKTFTMLKAGRISSKAPSITLKNFAEGAKYSWNVSQSTFTVTTP